MIYMYLYLNTHSNCTDTGVQNISFSQMDMFKKEKKKNLYL